MVLEQATPNFISLRVRDLQDAKIALSETLYAECEGEISRIYEQHVILRPDTAPDQSEMDSIGHLLRFILDNEAISGQLSNDEVSDLVSRYSNIARFFRMDAINLFTTGAVTA